MRSLLCKSFCPPLPELSRDAAWLSFPVWWGSQKSFLRAAPFLVSSQSLTPESAAACPQAVSRALCCSGLVPPRPQGDLEAPEAGPLASTSMVSSAMLSSLPRFSEQGGLLVDHSRTRVFQMLPQIGASLGLFGAIAWIGGGGEEFVWGLLQFQGRRLREGSICCPWTIRQSPTCKRASPRAFDAMSCVVNRQARLPPY